MPHKICASTQAYAYSSAAAAAAAAGLAMNGYQTPEYHGTLSGPGSEVDFATGGTYHAYGDSYLNHSRVYAPPPGGGGGEAHYTMHHDMRANTKNTHTRQAHHPLHSRHHSSPPYLTPACYQNAVYPPMESIAGDLACKEDTASYWYPSTNNSIYSGYGGHVSTNNEESMQSRSCSHYGELESITGLTTEHEEFMTPYGTDTESLKGSGEKAKKGSTKEAANVVVAVAPKTSKTTELEIGSEEVEHESSRGSTKSAKVYQQEQNTKDVDTGGGGSDKQNRKAGRSSSSPPRAGRKKKEDQEDVEGKHARPASEYAHSMSEHTHRRGKTDLAKRERMSSPIYARIPGSPKKVVLNPMVWKGFGLVASVLTPKDGEVGLDAPEANPAENGRVGKEKGKGSDEEKSTSSSTNNNPSETNSNEDSSEKEVRLKREGHSKCTNSVVTPEESLSAQTEGGGRGQHQTPPPPAHGLSHAPALGFSPEAHNNEFVHEFPVRGKQQDITETSGVVCEANQHANGDVESWSPCSEQRRIMEVDVPEPIAETECSNSHGSYALDSESESNPLLPSALIQEMEITDEAWNGFCSDVAEAERMNSRPQCIKVQGAEGSINAYGMPRSNSAHTDGYSNTNNNTMCSITSEYTNESNGVGVRLEEEKSNGSNPEEGRDDMMSCSAHTWSTFSATGHYAPHSLSEGYTNNNGLKAQFHEYHKGTTQHTQSYDHDDHGHSHMEQQNNGFPHHRGYASSPSAWSPHVYVSGYNENVFSGNNSPYHGLREAQHAVNEKQHHHQHQRVAHQQQEQQQKKRCEEYQHQQEQQGHYSAHRQGKKTSSSDNNNNNNNNIFPGTDRMNRRASTGGMQEKILQHVSNKGTSIGFNLYPSKGLPNQHQQQQPYNTAQHQHNHGYNGETYWDNTQWRRGAARSQMSREKYELIFRGIYDKDMFLKTELVEVEDRNSVMMRNIPNGYNQDLLMRLLEEYGFGKDYDYCYLPIDFRSGANMGYCFINFMESRRANQFVAYFHGFGDWAFNSDKQCEVTWAVPYQGLSAHIDRYRNSPVMHTCVPDYYKPTIFLDGTQVSFPAPTKALGPLRIRRTSGKKV